DIAKVAAKYNVPCILMHNRENAEYEDLMRDVIFDLVDSVDIALNAGVNRENIILDPGIGFAKTLEENLSVMNNLEKIKGLGFPVLLGTSRKSMIGLTLDLPVSERVEGTIATTVLGITKGCEFIRVHDVKENKRACVMTDAMLKSK
ncbi:MAG: dihydropteroate synthase, partial [Clostridium sp.]